MIRDCLWNNTLPFWQQTPQPKIISPLTAGFFVGTPPTPEELLTWSALDRLGLALLERAFGSRVTEPGRHQLARTVIQWEIGERADSRRKPFFSSNRSTSTSGCRWLHCSIRIKS